MWNIRADTGGTFTDCWGRAPTGDVSLAKVLSSGSLRVAIASRPSAKERDIVLPSGWNTPKDFFVGFRASAGGADARVVSFHPDPEGDPRADRESCGKSAARTGRLLLDGDLPDAPGLELATGEEAPVLGARLLTGTRPGEAFPPMDFRLATTRGTNALLERKGAPVALFITRGFGDLLRIGDQRRPDLFAREHHLPAPLFHDVVEVDERLDAEGEVLQPLRLSGDFEARARALLDSGVHVAAVALLHSHRHPEHEQRLGEALCRLGFEHVSLSSALAPLDKILPRAETAVANATLHPVMQGFLDHVRESLGEKSRILSMTSAGGLEPIATHTPKDALLSGPSGGVAGAAAVAHELGYKRILAFDMGGTSTDVARYDGDFLYQFEHRVGDARLLSPALRIETVASGGGSLCQWTEAGLRVGPESAGADPGPACYGKGGPLTVTDVHLLLGHIDPDRFGIPLSESQLAAAKEQALELQAEAGLSREELDADFLAGLLEIATEQMADAIRTISVRDGADPAEHALLAFGGAGPLHACDIAERLGMDTVLVPAEAGLLSAYGLERASVERFAESQANLVIPAPSATEAPGDALTSVARLLRETDQRALARLAEAGYDGSVHRALAEMRVSGQESTLSVEVGAIEKLAAEFARRFQATFGYPPPPERSLEVVSIRAIARTESDTSMDSQGIDNKQDRKPFNSEKKFIDRSLLRPGHCLIGPVIIQDPFSTLLLKSGWSGVVALNGSLILHAITDAHESSNIRERGKNAEGLEAFWMERQRSPQGEPGRRAGRVKPRLSIASRDHRKVSSTPSPEVQRELFRHRFDQVVAEMGARLQRSAISTNVKERADFSCALLDAGGRLATNAPHIPVHLGALGLCVRKMAELLDFRPGDTAITNHPGAGGSHLPDVTLVTPVFAMEENGEPSGNPVAFVANRAHHAEIGGISPGSMPPDAGCLAEEGVVIPPQHLVRAEESRFERVKKLLTTGPYPTRRLSDNLADLNAQLAANRRGVALVENLLAEHGVDTVREQLASLGTRSRDALAEFLDDSGFAGACAREQLDDGTEIRVEIARVDGNGEPGAGNGLRIDFTGTSPVHSGSFNATPAIVRSAVLYVLRLWTGTTLPLNEGLLEQVEIVLPPGTFLHPEFPGEPRECPAVVAGNVETSQRIVDALIGALGFQAGSQGTMNNLVFGDGRFGYYETIGGGAGAGPGYVGASGLHTHMTNTAITDPEILESRYPVRLREFSLRRGSGGEAKWCGGDGLVRELEFLRPLTVSLLGQHRESGPRGGEGGGDGQPGCQTLNGGTLPGVVSVEVEAGDILRIETPGGGGWG